MSSYTPARRAYYEANKERIKRKSREWYHANKEQARARQNENHDPVADRERKLMKHYGMTLEDFEAMFAAQGGRCLICSTDTPTGKGWVVDHCHETGKVRGVLCSRCNTGIGMLADDPDRVRSALAFLEAE